MLALVAAASVSGSGAATADARIVEVGWWRSVGTSQPPEGGVAIGGNATGPTAVAAIRVSVPGGAPLTAELTLLEAGNVAGDGAALMLCPTSEPWKSVAGGSMDEAPAPDCARGEVPLERDEAGAWTAEVASLLTAETASLMIVPATSEEAADPLAGAAPFEVSFEPPTLVATAPPSESGDSFERPSSGGSFGTSPSSDERPPFAPIPIDRGETAFAAPPLGGAPVAEQPATDQVAIAPSAPVPTRAVSDPGGGGGGRNWGQALSYTLMAAAIGGAAGVGRWQLRMRGMLPG